jgi:sugar transferase (PEP-CTERM system associated)
MPLRYNRKIKTLLFAGDLFLISISIYISFIIRLQNMDSLPKHAFAALIAVSSYIVVFYVFDLYDLTYKFKRAVFLARFILALIAGTLSLSTIFYLLPGWKLGRGFLVIISFFVFLLVFLWRLVFYAFIGPPKSANRIIIVGSGVSGEAIYDVIRTKSNFFRIVGFLDDKPELHNTKIRSHEVLGDSSLLSIMTNNNEIDTAVIAIKHEKNRDLLRQIVYAKMKGLDIYDMPRLYEELTGKLPINHMGDAWMSYTTFKGIRKDLYTLHIKRIADIMLSLTGLTLLSPLMLLTAFAIKLDSRGPVFYRQKRVGQNDSIFELLKFRSMSMDAESAGAVWAQVDDPRVTRVGRIIRKTRIDEVPQMWNVLKGEMSFIGPRPERPEFVAELAKEIPFYSFRHSVKSGITGWAQIKYRYGASQEDSFEKLQYDLYYIKNLSIFLDVQILLQTIKVVLFGQGAR